MALDQCRSIGTIEVNYPALPSDPARMIDSSICDRFHCQDLSRRLLNSNLKTQCWGDKRTFDVDAKQVSILGIFYGGQDYKMILQDFTRLRFKFEAAAP